MQPRQELLAHKPQGATVSAWSCSALTFVSVKGYVFRFIRLKAWFNPGLHTAREDKSCSEPEGLKYDSPGQRPGEPGHTDPQSPERVI